MARLLALLTLASGAALVGLAAQSAAAQSAPAEAAGTRFVAAGVGIARVEGRTGISATIGVSVRRGVLVATLSPLDVLILPKWDGEYQGGDQRCRDARGSFVESSLCEARAEYGASAEAGALLGSGTTRVWIGGGYVVGTTSTAYGGVTTLFRWGDAPHLQLRLRAGDRFVQGAVGVGGAF